jgi:spore germination cell wall hydrolase CwlJ-like protein
MGWAILMGSLLLTPDELLIVARTVWQEARGEPRAGKLAVVHVLHNRAKARNTDMATEALRPWQFSGWNPHETNRAPSRNLTINSASFRHCISAVLEAVDEIEAGQDPTLGSKHYHANYVQPHWSREHAPAVVIGRHIFYNTIR